MPDPQNRKPEEQRRMEELQRRREFDRPRIGSGWRTLWIWPVVVLFIALLWFFGLGPGSHGGWLGKTHGAVARTNNQTQQNSPGTDEANLPHHGNEYPSTENSRAPNVGEQNSSNSSALLTASNKKEFVGQAFEVTGAPVLRTVNHSEFWVGTDQSAPLLVVLESTGQTSVNAKIESGQSVNVVGTIEKAPPLAIATRDFHLDHAAAERLEDEGAFVNATQATPMSR